MDRLVNIHMCSGTLTYVEVYPVGSSFTTGNIGRILVTKLPERTATAQRLTNAL